MPRDPAGFVAAAVASQRGWTPLHVACYHMHLEVVKELLAAGANKHAADKVSSGLSEGQMVWTAGCSGAMADLR